MHPLINPVDLRKLITQFISVPIIGKISSYIREKIILGLFSPGEITALIIILIVSLIKFYCIKSTLQERYFFFICLSLHIIKFAHF